MQLKRHALYSVGSPATLTPRSILSSAFVYWGGRGRGRRYQAPKASGSQGPNRQEVLGIAEKSSGTTAASVAAVVLTFIGCDYASSSSLLL